MDFLIAKYQIEKLSARSKGEALSCVSKKVKNEDEKVEEENAGFTISQNR